MSRLISALPSITLPLVATDILWVERSGTAYKVPMDKVLNNSVVTIPGSYADDAAAASGGVPVGGLYHTSGVIHVRLA